MNSIHHQSRRAEPRKVESHTTRLRAFAFLIQLTIAALALAACGPSREGRLLAPASGAPRTSAALSVDGSLAAAGSADGSIQVWNTRSGQSPGGWLGHAGGVGALTFLPGTGGLLSSGQDGTVRVWNPATGEKVLELASSGGSYTTLGASPDGRYAAAGGLETPVRVWDLTSAAQLHELDSGAMGLAFTADGGVAAASYSTMRFYNSEGVADPARQIEFPGEMLLALAADRAAHALAVAGNSGLVSVVRDGARAGQVGNKGRAVTALAFVGEGRIAAAMADKSVHMIDVNGGAVRVFKGHKARIASISASPHSVLSVDDAGAVWLWSLGGSTQETAPTQIASASALSGPSPVPTTPENRAIPIATTSSTPAENASAPVHPTPIEVAPPASSPPNAANAVSSTPSATPAGTENGKAPAGEGIAAPAASRLLGHRPHAIRCVTFSPDGKSLLTAADADLAIWDIASGEPVREWQAGEAAINAACFSPDGQSILSGGDEKRLCLWNAATGELKLDLRTGKEHKVLALAINADGTKAATGGADGNMKTWDLAEARPLRVFEGHRQGVLSVAFSPDSRRVLSAGLDGSLRLWVAITGKEARRFDLGGEAGVVWCAAFASDGHSALVAAGDKSLRWMNLDKGEETHRLEGHTRLARCVAVAPDGTRGLSGGSDSTVRLWDLAQGKEITRFDVPSGAVVSVAFSPAADLGASGSDGGDIRLWLLSK